MAPSDYLNFTGLSLEIFILQKDENFKGGVSLSSLKRTKKMDYKKVHCFNTPPCKKK